MARRRHTTTVVRALLCTGAATAGALYLTADYLFRFVLEPGWKHSLFHSDQPDTTLAARQPHHDAKEEAEAAQWFEDAKRETTITAFDGVRLHGWVLDPDCSNPLQHLYAICCHGYSGVPAEMAKYAHRFSKLGFTVFTPAHRCHERSDGRYIGMGTLEHRDLLRWIDAIVADDPKARILLDGNSMGAATVMLAAGDPKLPSNVKAAIADCGYTSLQDQFLYSASHLYHAPELLAKPAIHIMSSIARRRAGYDFTEASCVQALRHTSIPMLFIHGSADDFVNPASLERNFRACASPIKQKLMIPGAAHAMSASTDPKRYWKTVTAFVTKIFHLNKPKGVSGYIVFN
ncbi:alpha/beta hydrolase [Bifidobacterium sp. ESL0775]|uniref:alpha/beta hydrolase n=1 Tax=Bifidobacterium sp. ESL0775 TaxID=2983230 RepID=UPI0023F7ED4D|nr:alpha/beta fold hydrolase [Bifidobacterium sp. ESL0775]WEV68640.1 alpha/beta hydrolase [Bifidobacterium sp. ESL0775]